MKFCSTCLSSCFRPPSILENSRDKKTVVSGALVFLNQENPTQDYGQVNAEDVKRDSAQNTTDNGKRLVFVNPAEIDLFQRPVPTNSNQLVEFQLPISTLEFQPPAQEDQAQAQALVVQERFQLPIPIKEAPRQVQSNNSNPEAQMFNQQQYWGQSVWDIPPSTSATPLPYEQINFETSKEPSPPPEQIVFGAGFMPIQRPDGVPSSMNGVEISQSTSQDDNSNNNKSGFPSPAPNPQKPSGGDNGVSYLLV